MLGVGSRKSGRSAVHAELASKLVKASGLKSLRYDVEGSDGHCVVTPTAVDDYSALFGVVRKNTKVFTMHALPEQYRTATNRAGYGVTISGEVAVFVVLCPVAVK
jgi:exo-beta-1,3-glucanase (GH17 family)